MIRFIGFLFLALGLSFTWPVSAQSISGHVTDAETGEPLPGASVFIPLIQSGSATGNDGRFRVLLPRPGTYRLVVSFVGYRSENRDVTVEDEEGAVEIDVALEPIEVEVSGVTVTAKAQASDILSTPQAVAVLEGRDLRENRGVTAFDALDKTAGFRTLSTGVGIAKPMIRGLTSQRVLVIQNGVRQEGQQWGDEHGPEIDAFDVDRIEVVKGPASLLYGSDALGGVIQATSEDLFDQTGPLNGAVSIQAMSNPELGAANLQLRGSSGANYYGGSFTWKRSGSYETPQGYVPNTGLEEINGSVRVGRRIGRGTVLAEYQRFDSNVGFFEPDEMQVDDGGDGFSINLPFQSIEHDKVRARLDLPISQGRLEAGASWQQNRRKEFEEHEEVDEVENVEDMQEVEEADFGAATDRDPALFLRLNTLTTDLRFHHHPIGRLFGTVGISGFHQKNETLAEETLIPGADTWNGAAYVFEELSLRQVTINGGLRFDARRIEVDENDDLGVEAQSKSYHAVSGALGLAWQPASSLSLAANVGQAWRAPALIELFGSGVHEGTIRFERGDPTLNRERSLSIDGTVRWLHPHVYVEINGYHNRIFDFIFLQQTGEVDPASGFFVFQYRQADARLWGAELTADLHPHPLEWLHFHITGDFTRATNLETEDPLPFTPPARLSIEASLTQEALGRVRDIRLNFGPTLVAQQDRVTPFEEPTDGYSIWDASLSASIPAGGMTIEPLLAIDNLFDDAYLDHLSRFRRFGILGAGRSVRLQVVATF